MKSFQGIKSGLKSIGLASILFGGISFANADTERVTNVLENVQASTNSTAEWQPEFLYGVTNSGNGNVQGTTNGWYPQGADITNNAFADSHYHFVNWSNVPVENEIDNPLVITNLSDSFTNVIANFIIDQHQLVVNSSHGTPIPQGTNSYDYDTEINASVAGNNITNGLERYVSTGWNLSGGLSGSGSGTNTTFNMTNNATLDWNWKTQYLFNATSVGEGTISGTTNAWLDSGSTNRLTANPSEGYHFTSWSPSGSTNATKDFVLTNAMTNVAANFSTNIPIPNYFNWVFRDSRAGISKTNNVLEGSTVHTNFPKYIYDGRTRYKAEGIISDTPILPNAP